LTRFVGREREVDALGQAVQRATEGHGQIVALVGEPGVGKSRLVWEFTRSHRTAKWLVLESGSVSYGKASAYRPVIDLLKTYFQIEDRDDVRRVREKVIGKLYTLDRALESSVPALLSLLDAPVDDQQWERLDPPQRRSRMLEACRLLLLRESRVQPLVVVFEDLHWIDNETQAFLDGLVESLPTAKILLLVNYRPEYHNHWTLKTYYTQIRVDPLSQDSAEELLTALLGPDPGMASLREILIARTDGNPFFLEESVRSLVETGALTGERGAYRLVTALTAVEVPATVQAILAARIDRLSPEDKHLLQAASVIGKDVPFTLLQAIVGIPETSLRTSLTNLQAAEFLYEASLFPDLEYTFKHALTHDVAYGSLLLERRKAVHAQILGSMERLYADRLAEQLERLAHHAMLGEVWSKAVGYARQAGEKAFSRSANRAAANYFEQSLLAARHLPATREVDEQTIDLHLSVRFCLVPLADFKRMLEHTRMALELSRRLDDRLRVAWSCAAMSIALSWLGPFDEALARAEETLAISRTIGNRLLDTGVYFYPGWPHSLVGNLPQALDALGRCADATLAGLLATPNWQRTGLPLANGLSAEYLYVFSQSFSAWCLAEMGRYDEALARGNKALEIAQIFNRTFLQATALVHFGGAHVMRGSLAEGLPLLERAHQLCKGAELPMAFVFLAVRLGQAYKLAGRIEEAVAMLEQGRDLAQSSSSNMVHPLILAHLAEAYDLAGNGQRASPLAHQALELARTGGIRGGEAWALYFVAQTCARQATPDPAQLCDLYTEAMELAQSLGMRPLVAHCHLALGERARKTGDRREAQEQLTVGAGLFREMGMQIWLEKTQSALQSL
jgi:tetratricopeptide (TPR) repeat protein